MVDRAADPAVVEQIAEEFLELHRKGKKPSVDEFCDRYPEHAEELRGFLPALVAVEILKPNSIEGSGPAPGPTEIGGKQLDRLGDYRILGEVGRGGMGVVYEAEQESLGRRVALKVLAHHLLNESRQVKRFLREARAAAKLHHTNIVPVFGVGQQNGHHYYVMQFIQGLGLDEVLDELRKMDGKGDLPAGGNGEHAMSAVDVARSILKERRDAQPDDSRDDPADSMEMPTVIESDASTSTSVVMPGHSELSEVHESEATYWDGVARIGIQVAEALEHAHEQGTLHRDIKPSNLLLDGHGQVWVTDFGLAKVAEADDLTHTGDILGTIRYMAPERFHGQCDARTDIYSLGITLYELLARRPAYLDPAREQLIRRIEAEPPTPLNKTTPGIPRDLETIVNKAIEKDPAHRYRTAQELADDLQRFVDDEPIHARRISVRERFVRWSRRNPALATSISVASVALILVAVLSVWVANSESRAADNLRQLAADLKRAYEELRSEQDTTRKLLKDVQEAESESQIESARLAMEKGKNLMNEGDAQRALVWYARALSQVEANPDAVELERFIRHGIAAARTHLFPLGGFRTSRVDNFQVSPDGRFVVTQTQIEIDDPRSPSATDSRPGGGFFRRFYASEIALWNAESDRFWTRRTTNGQAGMHFSPDGRFLLVGTQDVVGRAFGAGARGNQATAATGAQLYDLSEPKAPLREIELPAGFAVVGLGVDGTTVYGLREESPQPPERVQSLRPYRFEIETGTEVPFAHEILRPAPVNQRGAVTLAEMSPGGNRLFTSIDNSDFQVWQLDDPSAAPQSFDIENVSFVRFAPDERHVLIGVYEQNGATGAAGAIQRRIQRAREIQYLALDGEEEEWSDQVFCGSRDCEFSPDGGLLALIESDDDGLSQPRLTVRSTVNGHVLHSMALPGASGSMFSRTGRGGVRFHRQGRSLLLATNQGVRQFDLPRSSLIAAMAPRADSAAEFGFIRGGDAVYVCWADRQERYDLAGGEAQFTEHPGAVGLVSEDGSRIVVRSGDRISPVVRVIDSGSGTVVHESEALALVRRGFRGATNFSLDRRHFASADPDAPEPERARGGGGRFLNTLQPAQIHDSFSGEMLATVSLRGGGEWCVSPGGGWLAQWARTNTGDQLELIDLRTDASQTFPVGFGNVLRGLAFTSDERRLVVASTTRLVVFDLNDPEFARVRLDTSEVIQDAALLPDDRTILTLEDDAVIRAWDIETGDSYSMMLDCAANPSRIAVSSDGTRLATFHPAANGPRVRVWTLPAPVEGTADAVRTSVGLETGIRLEGRSIRELTLEELSAGDAPDDRTPEDLARWHEARAIDAIDQANWRPALWHLERWADERPDDPTPWAWTAYCHYRRGDMAATLDTLAQVREQTRGREKSFASLLPLMLNIVLVSRVPNEQALPHLDYQLQLDSGSTRSLWYRSLAYANMRRWDEAIPDLELVVQRWLDNYHRQRDLVAQYLAGGGHDDALRSHVDWMLGHWVSSNIVEGRASAALAGLIVPLDPDLTERAALLAQQTSRGIGRGGSGATVLVEATFRLFDTDEDGELSPAEQNRMSRRGRLAGMGIVLDGEKSVTREDLTTMIERSGGFGGDFRGRASRASFDDYDSDGDGELSPEEQEALPRRLIETRDIEPDVAKSMTREEFTAAQERAQRNAADQIFDRWDSDGDGELSPEERSVLPAGLVESLGIEPDAAKSVTREEFSAIYQRTLADPESPGFTLGGFRGQFGGPGGQFGGFGGRGGGAASVLVQLARGVAAYRSGDLDEATRALESARDSLIASRDANRASDPDSTAEPAENARLALVHLFLAMTEHQRENADATGEQMENAQALLDAHVDDPTTYDPNLEWWIFVREVIKEAEATLAAQ